MTSSDFVKGDLVTFTVDRVPSFAESGVEYTKVNVDLPAQVVEVLDTYQHHIIVVEQTDGTEVRIWDCPNALTYYA